jgi:hypothetical protein
VKYKQTPTSTLAHEYLVKRRSLKEIGAQYGMHPSSVRERLASVGVAFRRRGQYDRTHLKKEPPIDWSAYDC